MGCDESLDTILGNSQLKVYWPNSGGGWQSWTYGRIPLTEHQAEESTWWNVLPDNERQHWTLEPFTSVGPLAFGMSPGEVSEALSGVTDDTQRHLRNLERGATKSTI